MSLTLKSFGSPWKQAIKDVERETGQEAVLYRESYQQFKNTFEGCVRGQTPNVDAKQAWKRMYNESMPRVASPTANFNNLEASEVAAGMTIVNMGLEMVKGHAFMTKFAEQLADRYEAIDKPMLMRSLSRLFQVQKSVLTATDLESKTNMLMKDEGFAILFAMDKEEFVRKLQLVDTQVKKLDPLKFTLQAGGKSPLDILFAEDVVLQGGDICADINNRKAPSKPCRERQNKEGDCRWVRADETYTNSDGEQQSGPACISKIKTKPKVVIEKDYKAIWIYALLTVLCISGYLYAYGFSLDYYREFDKIISKADAKTGKFWGTAMATVVGALITYALLPAGIFAAGATAFMAAMQTIAPSVATTMIVTYATVNNAVIAFANYMMMFDKPILFVEFHWGLFMFIYYIVQLYVVHSNKLNMTVEVNKGKVIGPLMGAVTTYAKKYNSKVMSPVTSLFVGLLLSCIAWFAPWAWNGLNAGFGKCFSKGQKSAMTREVNNRRRRQIGENNNQLQLQDGKPSCACRFKTGRNKGKHCKITPKDGEVYCWRHKKNRNNCHADDESKTGN